MGRAENRTPEEFHAFANEMQRIVWQGVAAVMAARSSIAESHLLCEQARELLAARHDDRRSRRRPLNARKPASQTPR